jgi:hypothetical protein
VCSSDLRVHIDHDGAHGWFVLANLSARGYWPNAVLTGESERFYRFGAGLGASYLTSSMNLYSLSGGARIAESEKTLGKPTFLPVVIGLATYRFNETFTLLYGAGFTYNLGSGHFLPLLGLNWKISENWHMSTLLPAFLTFEYCMSDPWRLAFGAALNGDRFGYERTLEPGVTDHTTLHVVRVRALTRLKYGGHRDPQFRVELGLEGQRVDRSPQAGDETKYAGPYIEAGVEVPFGQGP